MNSKDMCNEALCEVSSDPYGTKQVQTYLLPIIKDIDALCRKNNIQYSLMGGALLGAVRNGGFIPWDDDIDIIFDRANYERFLHICADKLPEEYMLTGSIWVRRITRKDNSRIQQEEGCVDLFVFDNVPANHIVAKCKVLVLKLLQGMIKKELDYERFRIPYRILLWVTHILGLCFSDSFKLKLYDAVSQWGSGGKTKYINNYVTYFKNLNMKYPADILRGYKDISFEGLTLMIFEEYDCALTTQFGDYHVLPPEDQRKPTHLKPNR